MDQQSIDLRLEFIVRALRDFDLLVHGSEPATDIDELLSVGLELALVGGHGARILSEFFVAAAQVLRSRYVVERRGSLSRMLERVVSPHYLLEMIERRPEVVPAFLCLLGELGSGGSAWRRYLHPRHFIEIFQRFFIPVI